MASLPEHDFIVPFHGLSENGGRLFVLTRFFPAGDLDHWLKEQEENLTWGIKLGVMSQVAQACSFLHSVGVIHRDLKPDNILMDEYGTARVADFGLARLMDEQRQFSKTGASQLLSPRSHAGAPTAPLRRLSICGTESFMAPEVTLGLEYNGKCDVFSFGLCCGQIVLVQKPGVDFWIRETPGDSIVFDELRNKVRWTPRGLLDVMEKVISFILLSFLFLTFSDFVFFL